ncbi:MAG TPA: hypothetical protein PLO67_12940 [Saprospiraceae bacterium]|nr:hypothetical protein [Saprospiraceae bacterium]
MKTTVFLALLFTLFSSPKAWAQPCWPDGVQLYSQYDVDHLKSVSQGCTSVAGSVTLNGTNIVNLDSLDWITGIDGNLWINMNPELVSLQGLNNLTGISGLVLIRDNAVLANLTGLNNLLTIGGSLLVNENPQLLNLDGLNGLTDIGADLSIGNNPSLLNVDALGSLTTVGQTVNIGADSSLVSLSGLDNLTTVGRDIYISEMGHLLNLDGINQLEKIPGTLWISYCNQLSSISGFQNLDTIGGALVCIANIALTHFNGMINPVAVGDSVLISGCFALTEMGDLHQPAAIKSLTIAGTSLNNLDFLQPTLSVERDLNISSNELLTELSGFSLLETVGNNFWIAGNRLENLDNLHQLKKVGGALIIRENVLTSLSALQNLDSIGTTLELNVCLQLHDLKGLDSIKSLGGDLRLLGLESLSSLTGLENIGSIGGTLEVGPGNFQLLNFSGLDSLKSVGKNVTIYGNPVLTSLNGLEHLSSVGGRFTVSYNAVLSNCVVESLCHQFAVSPDSVFIESNAPGCNTPAEVQTECDLPPGQCLLNGITFDSQAEVDDFTINYPGCREILGDAVVHGPGITNLDSLKILTALGKRLTIETTNLTTLKGLENVDSIGGLITVSNNAVLSFCLVEGLCRQLDVSPDSVSIGNNAQGCGSPVEVKAECDLPPGHCLVNGIVFYSQAQVDHFSSNYPGCTTIEGFVQVTGAGISALDSLQVLTELGGGIQISGTMLTSLNGLENLTNAATLSIYENPVLTSLESLAGVTSLPSELAVYGNDVLPNLAGLEHLTTIGGSLYIGNNLSLSSLGSLNSLTAVGSDLEIISNNALPNLTGLNNLTSIGNALFINNMPQIIDLSGLDNLSTIGEALLVVENNALTGLSGLDNLSSVHSIYILANPVLTSLSSLQNSVSSPGALIRIVNNDALTSLMGMPDLSTVEYMQINENAVLTSLAGLESLDIVDYVEILDNPSLSDCAISAVCNKLLNDPVNAYITTNASGCNTPAEVENQCSNTPVIVEVRLDLNGNCQADATDTPVADVQVRLEGMTQMLLKPTDTLGATHFGYLESGPFSLYLPQFPAGYWNVCQEPVIVDPGGSTDTIRTTVLLSPLAPCPELSVQLGMPSFFRGCLVASDMNVSVQNTGAAIAEGVQVAVVLPSVLTFLNAVPPPAAQAGDTLYFDLGDLAPFAHSSVLLNVRTSCDTFLFSQTLCVETFATPDNACPSTLPAFSEVKLSATCVGDTLVRFTIKNIGDAPTVSLHTYSIIRNETVVATENFSLANQQSIFVDVPADDATYRMEATKFDDGSLTATAQENCGGLTPGLINAFWLDKGPLEYDFDCRQVIGSFDPNLKSAVPTGADPGYTIAANRPIQYTIDFQNTGTDTAYRVLLRDPLPAELDLNTFRPGFSSHPYTWEIRGSTLEVLFFPIALPDSNVNEPASHGFFSFDIYQKPDLFDGTYFQNTASIIFDFNPPIVTNTVYHMIGTLTVDIDEPQRRPGLWRVAGNPTRDVATFSALTFIAGEKRFELYDAFGRAVRTALFSGQSFVFQRDGLSGGVYFFRIGDGEGRWCTGKVVVVE